MALRTDFFVPSAIALAAAAFAAQATAQLVDLWAFDLRIPQLDGNSTSSAFSWVSGAAILTTALAFAWVGAKLRDGRIASSVTSMLFFFLLVDNRLHLHVRLEHGKALFLPILASVFVLLWRMSESWPEGARMLVRAGLWFLAASLVIHLTGPTVLRWAGWWRETDWQDQTKVALKEATEKAGWILVCFGTVAWARSLRAR